MTPRAELHAWFLDAGLTPGCLLDAGGGEGFRAEAAARGWKITGADGRDLAAFLKGRAAKEFDAAFLDGFERSADPRGLLEALKPVLKRGGHLAVVAENEERPAWFDRAGSGSAAPRPARWNAAALSGLLQREGFSVVDLRAAGPGVRGFSDMIFDGWVAPVAGAAARRVLFGPDARGTLSDLYSAGAALPSAAPPDGLKGFLADPGRRKAAADALKAAARLVTSPAAFVLDLVCRLRPRCGERLHCLARYDA